MKKIVEFFGFGAVISTNLTLRILWQSLLIS
jgi:hypothetical protein